MPRRRAEDAGAGAVAAAGAPRAPGSGPHPDPPQDPRVRAFLDALAAAVAEAAMHELKEHAAARVQARGARELSV